MKKWVRLDSVAGLYENGISQDDYFRLARLIKKHGTVGKILLWVSETDAGLEELHKVLVAVEFGKEGVKK